MDVLVVELGIKFKMKIFSIQKNRKMTDVISLDEKTFDSLKETKYDKIFGVNCPIRKGEMFGSLNEWLEQDPDLEKWLKMRSDSDYLKFEPIDLEKYFSLTDSKKEKDKEDIKANEDVHDKIAFFDILEKKYDIPEIAIALREFDINKTIIYLIEGKNDKFITDEMLENAKKKDVFGRTKNLTEIACELGSLIYLKWLRDPNTGGGVCPWDEMCCAYAAQNDHLNILKWLRNPNTGGGVCPWNMMCCIWAARSGHLHILKWLRDPNTGGGVCDWDEKCCYSAIKNNHIHILKWLMKPENQDDLCAMMMNMHDR